MRQIQFSLVFNLSFLYSFYLMNLSLCMLRDQRAVWDNLI